MAVEVRGEKRGEELLRNWICGREGFNPTGWIVTGSSS
ncbi:MAG: hypothetical protein RL077_743 [Verrucomicrobiota bacterium]